jgi:phage-related protein
VGTTQELLREFPKEAKRDAGQELRRVQNGLQSKNYKPMSSIGRSVIEIRIHKPYEHRVFYVANFPEGIYVLHAFSKKTQHTSRHDLRIGKRNYDYVKKSRK